MGNQRLTIGSPGSDTDPSHSHYDSTLETVDSSPAGDDTPGEFGKFEALSRKLVGVPKSELDEKPKG